MNKSLIAAERLKQCRINAKETLEHIAQLAGVHKSTVLRWENGDTDRIKISTISFLASHYNVNPAWLLGADVPMEVESSSEQQIITPAPSSSEEEELRLLLEELRNRPDMQMLFSVSKNCTKEEVLQAVRIIEALRKDNHTDT